MRRTLLQLLAAGALLALASVVPARGTASGPGCHPVPVTSNTPTGVAGCIVYGTGTASEWGGPGVARNDCTWPWNDCTPVTITVLATGRQLTVTPRMFCDCYTGTSRQRLVDLDPASVAALGLDPAAGLWAVSVEPARSGTAPLLPNTATASRGAGSTR